MKTLLVLLFSVSILLAGCFAPLNLTYDSAKTLDKGQIELKGAYSRYYVSNDSISTGLLNNNFGFGVGYGINDRYTLKMRYEYISPTITFQGIFEDIDDDFKGMSSMSYFEVDNKLRLVKDNLSISLPLGVYFYNSYLINATSAGIGWWSFDPRLYVSFFRSTNVFELSVIPKAHLLFGNFGAYILPGFSVGMGFSSDLDRWAIRPEIGYDRYLSFGIGANFNFNTKRTGTSK